MEIQLARWRLEVDVEATRATLAKIPIGYAERCGCLECRNFISARDALFARDIRVLLDRFGIDPTKEAECVPNGLISRNVFLYDVAFHFMGRIIDGADGWQTSSVGGMTASFETIKPGVSIGCSSHLSFVPEVFDTSLSITQLDLLIQVPWSLAEPPPR